MRPAPPDSHLIKEKARSLSGASAYVAKSAEAVENHLAYIYVKTDTNSRAELFDL